MRVRFRFEPESSDLVFACLTGEGCDPQFEKRGAAGDVISVPAKFACVAKKLIEKLLLI